MKSGVTVREEVAECEPSGTHTYPRVLRPVAVGFWTRFAVFALRLVALPPFLPPFALALVALLDLVALLALLATAGVVGGAPERVVIAIATMWMLDRSRKC